MSDQAIEQEILAKGLTAPRITPGGPAGQHCQRPLLHGLPG